MTRPPAARCGGRRLLELGALLAFVCSTAAAPIRAAGRAHRQRLITVEGIITHVSSSAILLQTSGGTALHLTTNHDFSRELLAGEHATAWYKRYGESNVLARIEPPLNQFLVPAADFMPRIHRAIVLPGSDEEGSVNLADQVANALRHRFGWFMPPSALAQEIHRVTVRDSMLDAMNSKTGAFDMSKYAPSHAALIRKIASQAGVDAVFEVHTEQEMVAVSEARGVANWDGTQQVIESGMTRAMARLSVVRPTIQIPAATMVVELWNAQGKLLWIGRKGLFLLVTQAGHNRLRVVSLSAMLPNRALVDQRIDELFSALAQPRSVY